MIFKPDEWDEILHKLISHFTSDFYSPQGTTEELGLTMDDTERLKQSILHIKENQKIQQLAMDHVYDTYYFRLFAPTRKYERIQNRREFFAGFGLQSCTNPVSVEKVPFLRIPYVPFVAQ